MKIDRSLVESLGESPRALDVLKATVALARALGHSRDRRGRGDRGAGGRTACGRLRPSAGLLLRKAHVAAGYSDGAGQAARLADETGLRLLSSAEVAFAALLGEIDLLLPLAIAQAVFLCTRSWQ